MPTHGSKGIKELHNGLQAQVSLFHSKGAGVQAWYVVHAQHTLRR